MIINKLFKIGDRVRNEINNQKGTVMYVQLPRKYFNNNKLWLIVKWDKFADEWGNSNLYDNFDRWFISPDWVTLTGDSIVGRMCSLVYNIDSGKE